MAGGFDLIVRTFFSDGLSAGLAKANASLNQFTRSGPGARVGMRAIQQGAQALAFSAAGLAGPMGRVAAGLLQIGGGNAVVLGAVAGLGAVALAYNLLTKESREAAEAEKKHREELLASARARAAAATPQTRVIGGQTGDARSLLDDANARRAQRVAFLTSTAHLGIEPLAELLANDAELRKIDTERADLSLIIALNRGASARAGEDEANASERELEARRALRLEAIQFLQTTIQLEKGGVFQGVRRGFTAPGFGGAGLGLGGTPTTFGNIRANVPRFVAPDDPAVKRDWLKSGQIIATGFFQAVQAFQQGGPGGILGGFGALANAGSQVEGISKGLGSALSVAGFVTTAAGAVLSLFDRKSDERERAEERRHEELKAVLHDGFLRVTFINADGTAEAGLYEMRRAERLGGEPRLGGL